MLNISFNELAIVGLLVVLLLKPKDYPIIVEQVKKAMSQILNFKDELIEGKYSFEKEIKDIEQDLEIIPHEDKKDDK